MDHADDCYMVRGKGGATHQGRCIPFSMVETMAPIWEVSRRTAWAMLSDLAEQGFLA